MQRASLVSLVAFIMIIPAVQADWASFHGDAQNTGHVAGSDYEVYVDVWWNNKTEKNGQITASPVLKDGKLIIADSNGLVRAVDAESGGELWRYAAGGAVVGTPAIEGERVYVSNTAGKLVALNLNDGRVEATASVGKTEGGISVYGGNVFIGNEAGEMKAYDTGLTLRWKFSIGTVRPEATLNIGTGAYTCGGTAHSKQPIRGAPMVYDGKVFFGSLNHHVYALDTIGNGDGTTDIMWVADVNGPVYGSPSLHASHSRGGIYMILGDDSGTIYRFSPSISQEGSNPCHGHKHPSPIHYNIQEEDDDIPDDQPVAVRSSPASAGDLVYFGANNGHLYALDARSMDLAWEQEAIGDQLNKITSSPAVANDIVVVGSENNNVYWLNAQDGSILKQFPTGSAIETSPAIDGSRAFIAAKGGTVYMFGPELPPRPDLIVASVEADAEHIRVTIKNAGEGDAESNGTVRVFQGGNLLADLHFDALGAGEEATLEHAHQIEAKTFALRAVADWNNDVVEEDEANNELQADIDLVPEETDDPEPTETGGETIGPETTGEDEGIPGPAVGLLLAGLAALAFLRRR